MRIATVLAVALLGTPCLAGPEHAQAEIQHFQLNIPRQSLDTALKDLAQQTGLQIGRFSQRIDGSAIVGPVQGNQTPEQALKTLLNNTGLEYKIVSDTTIAVYNPKDAAGAQFTSPLHGSVEGAGGAGSSGSDSKEVGKKPSQGFRVAQLDQDKGSSASSVGEQTSTLQENSNAPSTGLSKHLTLRNRIITTAHEPAYPEEGMPKARYRAYHIERARAGIALTMTAGSAAVSPDSPPVFNNLLVYKDEIVPWMKDLADGCHEHGAAIMIQLTHLGRRTRWDKAHWLPVVSPSHRREAAHRAFPKKLEEWDIERIIKDYADAAERMAAAGLDGLELQAYGHLMDQFWSPLTNELDAPYGGSLDNRLRFTFQVLAEIRKRVGPKFILGMRYTADEVLEGGLTQQDGLEISRRLTESGLIDFLNVVRGHIDTDAGLTNLIPIQGMPGAPHLDFAGEIRAATKFPTFHAGRIQDVATARHAIASGKLDMVGLTRAHMADPHIVRKILEGREEDIRPCVGANYCLDRIYQGGSAYCIHNAATGRELSMPHYIERASVKRKIVVVGAGPAGLEAARVAAERGHEVVVLEAANKPGGQVRLTAQSPRRREMVGIIDWRMAQCDARGVSFRFDTLAEVDEVLAENANVVIVATGGLPHTDVLESGNDLVVSTWDVISGSVKPGSNVLLYDDAGDHAALQAAEFIAASGAKLEIMTPDRTFAPEVMAMTLVPYMRSLQSQDVTFTVTFRLKRVDRDGSQLLATIGSDYGGVQKHRRVDQIVVNHGTIPTDDLYFALKPLSKNLGVVDYGKLIASEPQGVLSNPGGNFLLFRIGDAVSARNTHAAIYDALRLVKDL